MVAERMKATGRDDGHRRGAFLYLEHLHECKVNDCVHLYSKFQGLPVGDYPSSRAVMSHGLLLRLFLSPTHFSVHVALQYLMIYSDSIGITYYLTRRLREFTIEELRDVWGFVWCVCLRDRSRAYGLWSGNSVIY